jgi:hypothetical protein
MAAKCKQKSLFFLNRLRKLPIKARWSVKSILVRDAFFQVAFDRYHVMLVRDAFFQVVSDRHHVTLK